jgi:hypothetical protein
MSNVIPIGRNSESQFCVYGDESRFRDTLVFATAIFFRRDLDRAKQVLEQLRQHYRIPPTLPIHCRVLYNPDARRKCGVDHLDEAAVNELIATLVARMKSVPAACRFAWTLLPNRHPLVDSTDPSWVLPNEPKGVLGVLMQACFAVPADGSQGPSASESEIFVSADRTKIRFFGNKRYQAHRGYSGFSDVDAPTGQVFHIEPHVIPDDRWPDHPLLQVADVFAYICSHADPELHGKEFFTQLLKTMYWSRATLVLEDETTPEGPDTAQEAEESPG